MTPPSDVDDTHGRRSILRNLSNVYQQNDDEAERAIRRRTLGKSATNTSICSENSLVQEHEGLKNCVKMFQDNKISKDNAWSLTLIDNMANLCRSHHKTLKNFQIVGTTLEATTKIYGLRVDSVHSDIVRMSSGLGRMKSDAQNNINDDSVAGDNDINDGNNGGEGGEQPKAVKKKRVRKQVSTVTKNKDTLNARIDLIPMPDPLFSKINSIMGDVSSSNRLLLNIIQTKTSDLKLTMDDKFWDDASYEPIEFNEDDDYDDADTVHTELPLKFNTNPRPLRQQMTGYVISNTPIDDEEEEAPPVNNTSYNMSNIEFAFDMAAEVEPIPVEDNYAIDYDMDDGGNDFDELTQDDRAAISACKGLRRKTTIIEDLRPADTTKLEYSYRPLDNINQFWAGPSYWKFRKSRKLTMTKDATVGSTMQSGTMAIANAATKRKANRIKFEPIKFTTMIEDSTRDMDEDSDDGLFLSLNSKQAQKFKKNNLYKRWDSKKLKLPTDLQIDRNLFNYYTYCPRVSIVRNNASVTPGNETDAYDFDNGDDGGYTDVQNNMDDEDMDHHADHEMEHMDDVAGTELIDPNNEQIPDSQNNQTVQEIGHAYEGAPEMIQKIEIQFARRAKVIDMKQMKSVCLSTIQKQCEKTTQLSLNHPMRAEEKYKEGVASFGLIYNNLPHLLTKTMAENLSPSVAFYSILHLANEHRLRLCKSTKPADVNVFLIRQLDK